MAHRSDATNSALARANSLMKGKRSGSSVGGSAGGEKTGSFAAGKREKGVVLGKVTGSFLASTRAQLGEPKTTRSSYLKTSASSTTSTSSSSSSYLKKPSLGDARKTSAPSSGLQRSTGGVLRMADELSESSDEPLPMRTASRLGGSGDGRGGGAGGGLQRSARFDAVSRVNSRMPSPQSSDSEDGRYMKKKMPVASGGLMRTAPGGGLARSTNRANLITDLGDSSSSSSSAAPAVRGGSAAGMYMKRRNVSNDAAAATGGGLVRSQRFEGSLQNAVGLQRTSGANNLLFAGDEESASTDVSASEEAARGFAGDSFEFDDSNDLAPSEDDVSVDFSIDDSIGSSSTGTMSRLGLGGATGGSNPYLKKATATSAASTRPAVVIPKPAVSFNVVTGSGDGDDFGGDSLEDSLGASASLDLPDLRDLSSSTTSDEDAAAVVLRKAAETLSAPSDPASSGTVISLASEGTTSAELSRATSLEASPNVRPRSHGSTLSKPAAQSAAGLQRSTEMPVAQRLHNYRSVDELVEWSKDDIEEEDIEEEEEEEEEAGQEDVRDDSLDGLQRSTEMPVAQRLHNYRTVDELVEWSKDDIEEEEDVEEDFEEESIPVEESIPLEESIPMEESIPVEESIPLEESIPVGDGSTAVSIAISYEDEEPFEEEVLDDVASSSKTATSEDYSVDFTDAEEAEDGDAYEYVYEEVEEEVDVSLDEKDIQQTKAASPAPSKAPARVMAPAPAVRPTTAPVASSVKVSVVPVQANNVYTEAAPAARAAADGDVAAAAARLAAAQAELVAAQQRADAATAAAAAATAAPARIAWAPLTGLEDPSPMMRHVIEPSMMHTFVDYYPKLRAANDLYKRHLDTIKSFAQMAEQIHGVVTGEKEKDAADATHGGPYTTLYETQQYMAANRPRVRTMEEAIASMQSVQ